MPRMNKRAVFVLSILIVSLPLLFPYYGGEARSASSTAGGLATEKTPVFAPMLGPGKKVPIEGGYYLIYGFDKKPKLGMVIMKVEIFTAEGKKDTSFEAKADAGMPSMKGAHETGDRPFTVSKKGDYLLPVNIVMPGDWEIRLTLLKEGKAIFRGRYNFDV